MKKQYIQPSMKVYNIETVKMIADSKQSIPVSNGQASEWGSRSSGDWDDDED